MPEDMDVLIGRIKERIEVCKNVIKDKQESKDIKEAVSMRMDAYETILREIKGIIEHG